MLDLCHRVSLFLDPLSESVIVVVLLVISFENDSYKAGCTHLCRVTGNTM